MSTDVLNKSGLNAHDMQQVQASVAKLFEAREIAVIGASPDPTKLGSSPINAMKLLGYRGTIHVVNPKYEELLGHPCYPDVAALPDTVEAAMIILPAPLAINVAEDCADKGIKALIVISQGFGEAGGEGHARDDRLLRLAREKGVAVCGPNTNGLSNVSMGMAMSIAPIFQYENRIGEGRVGVISQSGAMVSSLLSQIGRCGLGVSKHVTCGNELILGVSNYIEYLVDDPNTEIIAIYLETIRNLGRFRAALDKARAAGKPIVAIKVGESASGQKAALSHTGAIAGAFKNIIALLESEGVYVADDLETLALICELLHRYDWDPEVPAKPFVASISGGLAIQTADVMARLGMPLTDPSHSCAAALEALPTQSHALNPYDIAAQNALIPDIIRIFRQDGYNQLLFGLVMLKPEIWRQVSDRVLQAKSDGMDKTFVLSPVVEDRDRTLFNDAGLLVTDKLTPLLKALKAIDAKFALERVAENKCDAQSAKIRLQLPASSGLVNEADSKAVLRECGFDVPGNRVFRVDRPIGAYHDLCKPLVMKGLSDNIAHKTEHGLVELALWTDEQVEQAWSKVKANLQKADPDADSILLEEMVSGGIEAIVGMQRDPAIGPVVIVGAGGILVELLGEAIVLIPPFDVEDVLFRLEKTRLYRLLSSYRGRHYDIDALADTAKRLGDISLTEPRIDFIDINPVLVQPKGGGVVALDAKVFLKP